MFHMTHTYLYIFTLVLLNYCFTDSNLLFNLSIRQQSFGPYSMHVFFFFSFFVYSHHISEIYTKLAQEPIFIPFFPIKKGSKMDIDCCIWQVSDRPICKSWIYSWFFFDPFRFFLVFQQSWNQWQSVLCVFSFSLFE